MSCQYLLAIVILGLASRYTTAYLCYACISEINEANVETGNVGCAEVSADITAVDAGTNACSTQYSVTDEGIVSLIRGTSTVLANVSNECTTMGDKTTCICNSEKCNSRKIEAPRTFDCYYCSSSDYFDNGCGEELEATSKFVSKVKGCTACYKTVTFEKDLVVRYQRGCAKAVDVEDECVGEEEERRCACKESLCNSAEGLALKSVTAASALLISLVIKLAC